jgi:hypothetical protein
VEGERENSDRDEITYPSPYRPPQKPPTPQLPDERNYKKNKKQKKKKKKKKKALGTAWNVAYTQGTHSVIMVLQVIILCPLWLLPL